MRPEPRGQWEPACGVPPGASQTPAGRRLDLPEGGESEGRQTGSAAADHAPGDAGERRAAVPHRAVTAICSPDRKPGQARGNPSNQ